jgi:sugar-specific transcriptional regulator TrmB/DNA-binding CsgD family transcriptional regulator
VRVLETLGVSHEDESAYLLLLREPDADLAVLAARLGRGRSSVSASLNRLEAVGLVTRTSQRPARWRPARPDTAIDVLIARRTAEFDQIRSTSREWLAEMAAPDGYQPEHLVEIVVGRPAIAARFAQLLQLTEHELLILDRPPYASAPSETDRSVRALLAAGVHVRGIYSPDSLDRPGAVEDVHSAVAAGEQARTHPDVPMKLAIADRTQALLPLAADAVIDSALVVHTSALLEALIRMFELLWDQSVPVVRAHESAIDQRLLTLLSAGLKDDAIARQLGVSSRTIGRRVAELMHHLGARTRFQAGATAERRRRP